MNAGSSGTGAAVAPNSATSGRRDLGVLLLDGFDFGVYWAAIEPFVVANTLARRAMYAWARLSLDGKPVRDAVGLTHPIDDGLSGGPSLDLIVCPPAAIAGERAPPEIERLRGLAVLAVATDPYDAFARSLDLIDREHGPGLAAEVEGWRLRLHSVGEVGRSRGSLFDRFALRDEGLLRAVAFITAWSAERPQTEAIAAAAGLSSKKLQAAFKAQLGLTPQELVLKTRLDRAQWLLQETSMPVEKVGVTCGFERRTTFNRCYWRRFGRSPNRERESAAPGQPQRRQSGQDNGMT